GLLFLIEAAELHRHAGGEMDVVREPRADGADGCAEVRALEARGDGDGLAEAVAIDLGLSGVVLDRRDLIDAYECVAVRSHAQVTSSGSRCLSRSFTAKSPVFGSVTPARPSCMPVRREKLSTSGVAFSSCSTWRRMRSVSASEAPGGAT